MKLSEDELKNITWRLERANRSERKGYWMQMYRKDVEYLLSCVTEILSARSTT